jgi:hypothetical protein
MKLISLARLFLFPISRVFFPPPCLFCVICWVFPVTQWVKMLQIFQILGAPNEETWPGLTKLPGVRPNIKQM